MHRRRRIAALGAVLLVALAAVPLWLTGSSAAAERRLSLSDGINASFDEAARATTYSIPAPESRLG